MSRLPNIDWNLHEILVSLTAQEVAELHQLAAERQQPKDKNLGSPRDKRIDPSIKNEEMHYRGLLGEFACSKMGIPIDRATGLNGRNGIDFTLYGTTGEIKTLQGNLAFDDAIAADGSLILGINRQKNNCIFRADVAVLCVRDLDRDDEVWIEGWIPRAEFAKSHFVANFGYGDKLCMRPIDLFPIHSLRFYCYLRRPLHQLWSKITERV